MLELCAPCCVASVRCPVSCHLLPLPPLMCSYLRVASTDALLSSTARIANSVRLLPRVTCSSSFYLALCYLLCVCLTRTQILCASAIGIVIRI